MLSKSNVLVYNDCAYFFSSGTIHYVMCTRPMGFALFDFNNAIEWKEEDEDDAFARELIKRTLKAEKK